MKQTVRQGLSAVLALLLLPDFKTPVVPGG